MSAFFQQPPRLGNQYLDDPLLSALLRRRVPRDVVRAIEPGLEHLGERAATDLLALAAEAEAAPPRHVPFDPWGRRIDEIVVSPAWKALDRAAAEEGIVAAAYDDAYGPWARVHQVARLYLYHPSSAIYSCPLAMTDGAARAIAAFGDHALKARALPHLTSRDPREFWTSGQWMTERTGGSDVSGTSTTARRDGDTWLLSGTKWFTSATTSQVAMTLARPEGAAEGSRGLSLFYLELRDADGRLNGITVHRLKDKLGTRALPTAELTLSGTRARLVGGEGHGVRKIATLFNVTRVYNAVCALGTMRRGLALAQDYARTRRAFGRTLAEHPLHVETLAALETEWRGAFHLVFRLAELLGRAETGSATSDELAVLRALTPLAKLYTAKQCVAVASEVLECFGGAGYIEDTGLPQLLRDAQVLAIWEGTTNVLSLDLLRAIARDGALPPLLAEIRARVANVRHDGLSTAVHRVREALGCIEEHAARCAALDDTATQASARGFAFALARTYIAALLVDWADGSDATAADLAAARRWALGDLAPIPVDTADRDALIAGRDATGITSGT